MEAFPLAVESFFDRLSHRICGASASYSLSGGSHQEKLTPLLRLKYHNSIADAVADLGRPEEIGKIFAGFQKYLYEQET